MLPTIEKYISDLKQLIERLKNMAFCPDVNWRKRRAILETASYLHSKIRIATQFDFKYRRSEKMLETIAFWKSNLKGICNYYLAALPKQEQLKDGQEIKGTFLRFVMEKAKENKFEEIMEALTPEMLNELMTDMALASAFMFKRNKQAFFIREVFVKKDGDEKKEKNEDPKSEADKQEAKKKKESVFA